MRLRLKEIGGVLLLIVLFTLCVCGVSVSGWDGCHGLSGGHDPYDSAVIPGRRFRGALWVAVPGVAVGGVSGPSNEGTLACLVHHHLLWEDRDTVYVL